MPPGKKRIPYDEFMRRVRGLRSQWYLRPWTDGTVKDKEPKKKQLPAHPSLPKEIDDDEDTGSEVY